MDVDDRGFTCGNFRPFAEAVVRFVDVHGYVHGYEEERELHPEDSPTTVWRLAAEPRG